MNYKCQNEDEQHNDQGRKHSRGKIGGKSGFVSSVTRVAGSADLGWLINDIIPCVRIVLGRHLTFPVKQIGPHTIFGSYTFWRDLPIVGTNKD
jgi:hypothetical protein